MIRNRWNEKDFFRLSAAFSFVHCSFVSLSLLAVLAVEKSKLLWPVGTLTESIPVRVVCAQAQGVVCAGLASKRLSPPSHRSQGRTPWHALMQDLAAKRLGRPYEYFTVHVLPAYWYRSTERQLQQQLVQWTCPRRHPSRSFMHAPAMMQTDHQRWLAKR